MGRQNTRTDTLGPVGVQVLLSLAAGDRHGYGIKLDIEERTDGAMSPGSGTLYEAIQRLRRAGYIAALAAKSDGPRTTRTRRNYRLTPAGRRALAEELKTMEKMVAFGRAQLGEV